MRQSGYYWVKIEGEWYIAHYSQSRDDWDFEGRYVWDGYFDEIDETRIERKTTEQ